MIVQQTNFKNGLAWFYYHCKNSSKITLLFITFLSFRKIN